MTDRKDLLCATALFVLTFATRICFFSGFILGDDTQEFQLVQLALSRSLAPDDQLSFRFGVWLPNAIIQALLGTHEATFFLPTWLFSAVNPVIGYLCFRQLKYSRLEAFAGGALIGLSPFEVLIGTVRANDLFLETSLALLFYVCLSLGSRPGVQGTLAAVFFWWAFYIKLWAVFALPVIGVFFLYRALTPSGKRALFYFCAVSMLLHLCTVTCFKLVSGYFIPFTRFLPGTGPVPPSALTELFAIYPRYILFGSEHQTTLFGLVPYMLAVGVGLKAVFSLTRRSSFALDRLDLWLILAWGSFFFLLNFCPNHFRFDRYFSAPRIFRYLTPLSFFFALHTAKCVVDLSRALFRHRYAPAISLLICTAAVLPGTLEALSPGRAYGRIVFQIRNELSASCPPAFITDSHQDFLFNEIYLRQCPETAVLAPRKLDTADCESGLRAMEPELPEGSVLLTGLPFYAYHTCLHCSFRLSHFAQPLNPRWQELRSFGTQFYDPSHEPVRLWRLSTNGIQAPELTLLSASEAQSQTAEQLFARGISYFDKEDYANTRRYMKTVESYFPQDSRSADARYFYAVSFWRERKFHETTRQFRQLLQDYPASHWVPAAWVHIGMSQAALKRRLEAEAAFTKVIQHYGHATYEAEMAQHELDKLNTPFAPLDLLGEALTRSIHRLQRYFWS